MLLTIQKASEVLALYDHAHNEWGVREVAEKLSLAKSSAHDLLMSLAQTGLLNKTEAGRYRLGWRLIIMSQTLLDTTELRQEAHPVMEDLVEQYRETVHLALLDDTKIVHVDKLEGRQTVRVELSSLGSWTFPHCSAAGKVLLAHQPQTEVERIVGAEGLPSFTHNTITDLEELHRTLAKIREQGYSLDLEEILPDLCCIGAPIYNHTHRVVGALSMCTPIYRFLRSQVEYRTATINAAKLISKRLGYPGR